MSKRIKGLFNRVKMIGKYLTGGVPWDKRAVLAIEVSGYCNIRCPMCSYPNMKRKKGFMSWELFDKIVADVIENGHNVASLHFFGEPLMWPHIVEGVDVLAKHNIFPRISTNGMLLTTDMAKRLQDAGLKEIMVTIDTLIPELYERIRAGADFNIVKQNIHNALEVAPNLLISAQLMPTEENKNETPDDFYKEFGRRHNFRVEPWFVIRMNNTQTVVTKSFVHSAKEIDKRLCSKIFDRLDVLWNGITVLCCLDVEGQLVTGNLNENTINYSWLGPQAMKLRRMILEGKWNCLKACRECMADHIVMEHKKWRITDPLAKLPFKQSWTLNSIRKSVFSRENLGS